MSQGNKLKFQRSAASNSEFEHRNKGAENRHHGRHVGAPRKKTCGEHGIDQDTRRADRQGVRACSARISGSPDFSRSLSISLDLSRSLIFGINRHRSSPIRVVPGLTLQQIVMVRRG